MDKIDRLSYARDFLHRALDTQREDHIIKSLRWLLARDLLVLHDAVPVTTVVEKSDGTKTVAIEGACQLVVKDYEYIMKLEAQLAEARKVIEHYDRMVCTDTSAARLYLAAHPEKENKND